MMVLLDRLGESRLFRPLDLQVAELISRLDQGKVPELPVAAALASWASGQGHTCLPLAAASALLAEAGLAELWPDPVTGRDRLRVSALVGWPGAARPLILDADGRLFLHRLHQDEATIARALGQRAAILAPVTSEAVGLLDRLFPREAGMPGPDGQRVAAALALCKPLTVITGGPGTGKTYVAARILAALQALAPSPLRTALAAPTGKAALRLQESIRAAKSGLPPDLATLLPDQAGTLHRLLGFQPRSRSYRYHAANPLPLDLLILDEASMIDVPLMAATVMALSSNCRLLLLGDRDQLASVEAGNLFGDLCGPPDDAAAAAWSQPLIQQMAPLVDPLPPPAPGPPGPLADSLAVLQVSRRFRDDSGIGRLAQAVKRSAPDDVAQVLMAPWPDLTFEETGDLPPVHWLRPSLESCFLPLFAAQTPQQALQILEQTRILCALREGPTGVEGLNRLAVATLRRRGCLPANAALYRGLPLLILRNNSELGLFNGDTGVVWPDDQGMLQAWFTQPDGTLRAVAPSRLPTWQPAYAITVHKSQGSEFTRVLLVLPHADTPLLCRELLYTGITRARNHLTIFGSRSLCRLAVQRGITRYSGLGAKLRAMPDHPTDASPPSSETSCHGYPQT